jgi:hypothetical protein
MILAKKCYGIALSGDIEHGSVFLLQARISSADKTGLSEFVESVATI